jgi:hypothetical protein
VPHRRSTGQIFNRRRMERYEVEISGEGLVSSPHHPLPGLFGSDPMDLPKACIAPAILDRSGLIIHLGNQRR